MSVGRSPRFHGTLFPLEQGSGGALGDLPPSCLLVALAGYLARKRSRTSLISVPCVQSMPCGASSISTYSAEGRRLMNSRPGEAIGRMRSSVPWTIRDGTVTLSMSARKSVSHESTTAKDAYQEEPAATVHALRSVSSLGRFPRKLSVLKKSL